MQRWLKVSKRIFFASSLGVVLARVYASIAGIFRRHNPVARFSPRLFGKWQTFPAFMRMLAGNLLVGLGVSLLLVVLHGTPLHRGMQDSVLDWMMQIYSGTQPEPGAIPFAFLDVDDATFRSWGEHYVTPRDKLVELLRFALAGNPAAVIVDFDLSYRVGEGDDNLAEFIRQYPGNMEMRGDTQQDVPPVFLTRIFRRMLTDTIGDRFEIRPSFLEQDVAASPHVHWASPLFDVDEDFVIRGWRPWEVTCEHQGVAITPSVQLLAYLHLKARLTPGIDAINRQLSDVALAQCETGGNTGGSSDTDRISSESATGRLVAGDLHLRQAATPLSRRFIYEIPWKIERGKTRPVFDYQGSTVPLISIRSAGTITEHPERVDNSWLAGHVVIIGGSFSEGRDLFPTPIGQMPGALILVNAIHSLLQYGELGPPPLWLTLMLQVLLILIISLVFSRFDTFWGLLVSGGVVILLLLPVSIWVFRYGVWVDIALPLLAVQLHHMAAEFRENDALQESKRNVQT